MKSLPAHPVAFIFVLCLCLFSGSCTKGKKTLDSIALDTDTLPLMHSRDVSTLISDSGVTKYRLIAKTWDMYDKKKDPYWYFPDGVYAEKFDSLFNVDWSIKADTGYNYYERRLWHIIGNVEVVNMKKERFETEELFWDENRGKIYSSKNIKIEQKDRTVFGIGFESDQTMSDWIILKPGKSEFYFSEDKEQNNADPISSDSISKQ